ncbi:MAG: hypothetical protein IJ808_05280 [Muribaculaceae bacterium]|nr:hypothetical protein [Muribaculaceae bacterium]
MAQQITHEFQNESMSKALKFLQAQTDHYKISFVYNELEDFRVSTRIQGKSVPQSIEQIIGYYPIKMTQNGDNEIYVECVQKARTKLSGRVVDEAGQPLAFGNVRLLSVADSSFINGGVTNEDGRFVIPCEAREVIAQFTYVGYKTLHRLTRIRNMGTVAMHPDSKVLKEAVVEGSRFIQKVDRYIIAPDSALLARSVNSLDVFDALQLPGLDVDLAFKKMTINGQDIVYKVNGMPKTLADVQAIRPNHILRIEYSDNPGIRYSDSNVGGTINVILKERPTGGSLHEEALYCPTTTMHDNLFKASYNYKKSEFAVTHYLQRRDYNDEWHNKETAYIGGGDTIARESRGDASRFDYWLNRVKTSYTYQHDKNTGFQAEYNLQVQPRNRFYPSRVTEWRNGQKVSEYTSTSEAHDRTFNHSLDLFFGKKFNAKNSIEAQLVGNYANLRNNGTLVYDYLGADSKTYHSGVDNRHYSVIGEVTYRRQLGGGMSLRMGMADEWTRAINDYVSGTSTRLRSNNNYTYAGLMGRLRERYNWSVGTGLKAFTINDGAQNKTFVNTHSAATFGGQPFKGFTFSLYTEFKPQLPQLANLDSVTQQVDNIYAVAGNPALKPAHNYYGRLWLRYTRGKFQAYLRTSISYTRNPICGIVEYYADGHNFVERHINGKYYIANNNELQLSLLELWDHLSLVASANYTPYLTDAGALFHHRLDAWNFRAQARFHAGKFSLGTVWQSRRKTLYGETVSIEGSNWVIIGQYSLNKNLSLQVQGIWVAGRGDYYEAYSRSAVNPQHRTQVIRDNATSIRLGVTYNLDFGRKFQQSKRTLRNTDNANTVKTVN